MVTRTTMSPCRSGNHGDCEGRHSTMNEVEHVLCNCPCHKPAKCKYCQEEIRWIEQSRYGKTRWIPMNADRRDYHHCNQYRQAQAPKPEPKREVTVQVAQGVADIHNVTEGLARHGLWQYQGSDEVTGAMAYTFKHVKPEQSTNLMLVDPGEYANSGGVVALVMRRGHGEPISKYRSLGELVRDLEADGMICMARRDPDDFGMAVDEARKGY